MEYTEERRDKASSCAQGLGKKGEIFSINYSKRKGVPKEAVKKARLIEDFGLELDAHSGPGLRQVSLLAIESIVKQANCPKTKKKNLVLGPGDFAENITTKGLDLAKFNIAMKIRVGREAILEISKLGKECHRYCAVYQKLGDCIMPREGIFARVVKGGEIRVGDEMEVINNEK